MGVFWWSSTTTTKHQPSLGLFPSLSYHSGAIDYIHVSLFNEEMLTTHWWSLNKTLITRILNVLNFGRDGGFGPHD